jgi:hypothetical protein
MARKTQIMLGAVNIALPKPHSAARYAELWSKMFALKKPVRIFGDQFLLIGSIEPLSPSKPDAGYTGTFYRFTEIDFKKPWLDLDTIKEADHQVVKEAVKIPDNLRPNLSVFRYAFFADHHRLVIESNSSDAGSLSPHFVEKLITQLMADPQLTDAFPDAVATIEQDKQKIDDFITYPGLIELEIVIKRPNPDDDSNSDEEKVLKELEEQHAKSQLIVLKASSGSSLTPNKRTKRLANVASSNGTVNAVLQTEDGKKKPVSSRKAPLLHPIRFNKQQQLPKAAFLDGARQLAAHLRTLAIEWLKNPAKDS